MRAKCLGERPTSPVNTLRKWRSLMSLISRGCYRAIRTGAESLTAGLLDEVRIDQAAEDARSQVQAAIHAGPPRRPQLAGREGAA
jgi:hypothetical protein